MIPGLPDVEYWIWPQHMLKISGRSVLLSRREGDLISVMLSNHRKSWTFSELLESAYQDPDDEPEWGEQTIRSRIIQIRAKCARHGIDLRINAMGRMGCRITRISLVENWTPPVRPQIQYRRSSAQWLGKMRNTAPVYRTRHPEAGPTKLSSEQVVEIRNRWNNGEGARHLADDYRVTPDAIRNIISRRTWATVS